MVFLLQGVETVDALLHVLQTFGVDLDVIGFSRERLCDVAQLHQCGREPFGQFVRFGENAHERRDVLLRLAQAVDDASVVGVKQIIRLQQSLLDVFCVGECAQFLFQTFVFSLPRREVFQLLHLIAHILFVFPAAMHGSFGRVEPLLCFRKLSVCLRVAAQIGVFQQVQHLQLEVFL